MIGRASVMNTWVMSIQYDFSERMVLLTADATYIQRRKKIKSKLASLQKNQMNKEIVAQRRVIATGKLRWKLLCRCFQQLVRRGPVACMKTQPSRQRRTLAGH
jgi:hypothetical protein